MVNAHSIATPGKIDDLRLSIDLLKPDIVIVTETWLRDIHDSVIFNIDGYQFLRCDRLHNVGGGVGLWINSRYKVTNLYFPKVNKLCEAIFVHFYCGKQLFLLSALYIAPNLNADHSSLLSNALIDALDDVSSSFSDILFVLGGDFNHFDTGCLQSSHDLTDKVFEPTRGNAVLDRFLVSRSLNDAYLNAQVGPPLSTKRRGSHCQVLLRPSCCFPDNVSSRKRFLYDFNDDTMASFFKKLSQCTFYDLYSEVNLDKKVEIFYSKFFDCISSIPCKTILMSDRDKPWMTPYLKDLINKRWQAYRSRNFVLYKHYKEKCHCEILRCKKLWVSKSKLSNRGIWNVVSDVKGKTVRNPLSPILSDFSSTRQAADEINHIFAESFSPSDPLDFPLDDEWCPLSTPHDVFAFLEKLSVRKSTGSDGIPNKFYKLASPFICEPLSHILNSIVIDRYVPVAFKCCIVSPVPKCTPVSLNQLRPITLLSVPAKLVEHHILKHSRPFIHSCVPKYQFAYKPMSSTVTCLIHIHNVVTDLLESSDVGACFLINYDFSKAFDRICHSLLLGKLKHLGFPFGFIRFICSYLSDRKQCVKIGDCLSSSLPVTSGAPQGSLLGPFLFMLYCHDILPLYGSTSIFMYADDISEVCPVSKVDYVGSIDKVLTEFHYIQEWSSSNSLRLNSDKTRALCFRKKNFEVFFPFPFCVVESCKLLGVLWNEKLQWSLHFDFLLKCASKRLYILRVLKQILSHDDLWHVFDATIVSLLMYSTQLFGPLDYKSKIMITRLFKRAKRLICVHTCDCGHDFSSFVQKRDLAFRSLHHKSSNPDHPLYPLIPRNPSGRVIVPFCATNRRQYAFPIFSTMLIKSLCRL